MHYVWKVKNEKTMWKNVFLNQFWSFVLFSFCVWFYVFAPGSHCFAIDIFNRSAICTVHFRSIWTAPLRFSTCRSWAGSKVIAAKLDPQKSNLKKKNQSSTFPTESSNVFSHFLTFFDIFDIFHIFFPSAISKRIFSQFFPSAFSKRILKMRLEKTWKMRFENVKKCEKMCKACEKMGTRGSWKVPAS